MEILIWSYFTQQGEGKLRQAFAPICWKQLDLKGYNKNNNNKEKKNTIIKRSGGSWPVGGSVGWGARWRQLPPGGLFEFSSLEF